MRTWLKNIRMQKKLSTYQVAQMAGISQSGYSAIENGARGKALKVSTAQAIAKALGFNWLLFYKNEALANKGCGANDNPTNPSRNG
jgi:putative transcriptional regulator